MEYPDSQLAFVEDGLRLPRGSIVRMVGADEWAMVLKLHAVIEAVINIVIAEADAVPVERVATTSMGQTTGRGNGKAKRALALNALSEQTAIMLDALTSIRNEYAHNPRHALLPMREVVLQSRYREKIERGIPFMAVMEGDDKEWRSRVLVAAMWVLATLVRALLKMGPDADFDARMTAALKPDRT